MILKKDGVNLMETADAAPGKVPEVIASGEGCLESVDKPKIIITVSGEMAGRVSNIEVYFKEDKDEIR